MTQVPHWRKSTHSGQETNCVEIANTLDAIRDSKNTTGPTLTTTNLTQFITTVKSDHYQR